MTYVSSADFRLGTLQPWTSGLTLSEADGTNTYLDLVIAQVTTGVELDLHDDFEPVAGDADETLITSGSGLSTWHPPWRVRSLTSVSIRDSVGTLSAAPAGSYRLWKSLNAAGTAMVDGRKLDALEILEGFPTVYWPDTAGAIELVGKFGWAAVPTDVKRLVSLRVYGLVKARSDPLTTIVQRTTIDAVMTFGPSAEERDILERYARFAVMSS